MLLQQKSNANFHLALCSQRPRTEHEEKKRAIFLLWEDLCRPRLHRSAAVQVREKDKSICNYVKVLKILWWENEEEEDKSLLIVFSAEQLSSSTVGVGSHWVSQTREQTVQALPVPTAKVCHSPILFAASKILRSQKILRHDFTVAGTFHLSQKQWLLQLLPATQHFPFPLVPDCFGFGFFSGQFTQRPRIQWHVYMSLKSTSSVRSFLREKKQGKTDEFQLSLINC